MELKITLPRPHPGQQQVLDSPTRFKVLMCGRRWGKTLTAMILCITKMLDGERIAYLTPEFSLAKDFFREILKYLPKEILITDNKSELFIELVTGGSLKFFSGEALNSFRGRKFHYVIVDEAAFIPELKEQWDTSIRPTLSDYRGGGLFISTPNGKEYFNSLYIRGKDKLEEEWESFHFSSDNNPYFSREEFSSAKKSIPHFRFAQEYLAIPGESSNNPFGTDNINNAIIPHLSDQETVIYGIDIAKYSDYTVILGLDHNGHMTYYDRFQKPWEYTKNKIKELPNNIQKVMDATGVGDVLFEQLMELPKLIGFKFTTESKPRIIYELINAVEKGKIKIIEEVSNEMHTFIYKYSSTGYIKFQAQSGFHDDSIMALAMAYNNLREVELYSDWKLYMV